MSDDEMERYVDAAGQPLNERGPDWGRNAPLHVLQAEIARRWGSSAYGPAYLARTDPQRDAHHAVLHVTKALGKIAGLLDELDHDTDGTTAAFVAKHGLPGPYLADLVICAARIAERWPGGAINLGKAVAERLASKFPPAADYWPEMVDLPDDLVARLAWKAGDRSGVQPVVSDATSDAWNWTTDSPTGFVVVARAPASEHGSSGRRWIYAAFAEEHARRRALADPKCPACPGGAGQPHKLSCALHGKQQVAITVDRSGR
jgi:hypothetical protein